MAKKQEIEIRRDKRAKVAHGIATNIDPSINMARSLKTCGSKHKHEKEPKKLWIEEKN